MAKKQPEVQVVEGIYSTQTLNADGTVASFVVDDDKLFKHVEQALADYAAGKIGLVEEVAKPAKSKKSKTTAK